MTDHEIIQDLTQEEKLTALSLFYLISNQGEHQYVESRQKRVLYSAKLFGITETEFIQHIYEFDFDEVYHILHRTSAIKMNYFIYLLLDILTFDYNMSTNDLAIAKNIFHGLAGLDLDSFDEMVAVHMHGKNLFRERYQIYQEVQSSNTVSQVYDRMIREAQDPNQSPFSLNNIVLTVFVFLAVFGLVSLCS